MGPVWATRRYCRIPDTAFASVISYPVRIGPGLSTVFCGSDILACTRYWRYIRFLNPYVLYQEGQKRIQDADFTVDTDSNAGRIAGSSRTYHLSAGSLERHVILTAHNHPPIRRFYS